jgi:hypothetical protein
MRSFLAGLLILALSSAAFAQVRGEVESIGFGNGFYRPECWTPMVVRLQSQISEPAEYRIEVHQHDLDFDHVIYVKEGITLNGQATQRWEVCFLPEPIHGGLPDGSARDLQDRLRVYLTNKEGTRQIIQLPVTSGVQSLDSINANFNGNSKGCKLVLSVANGSSKPAWSEYDRAIGMLETPIVVATHPDELPQSVLAYGAVDAVVWISGDSHVLSEQGSKQLTALQQWVRQGGSLVICQPASDGDRGQLEPFADMLPIVWKDAGEWKVAVQEKTDLAPLTTLARYRSKHEVDAKFWKLSGKFPFARATARPAAVVDEWIEWDNDGKDKTPYIARIGYGLGSVTWVAQDLGNPQITGPNTTGWPYVWDAIFGWKNNTRIVTDKIERDDNDYSEGLASSPIDLGAAQLRGVEFGAKGAGLIVLAIFFFIAYWIVAGPLSYLFLANRKKKELSWTAFGAAALVATVLTVLVVRLVLRGSPEIHHASDVRMATGPEAQPAIAYSRLGVYIPRDGDQRISLSSNTNTFASYLTPLAVAPTSGDNDFPANLDYRVPVRDDASNDPVSIDVPFRSTLKKLGATWSGDIAGNIRGTGVKLNVDGGQKNPIAGTLDNLTNIDLHNIYVAFRAGRQDFVLYLPSWAAASGKNRIDLSTEYQKADLLPGLGSVQTVDVAPDGKKSCRGDIEHYWAYFWHRNPSGDDLSHPVPNSFPMLSFYDRIPPSKQDKSAGTEAMTLLRRGARNLDMSEALAAGQLVVLAQADGQPLPFPLEVNGDKIAGVGTVFYQFALPLDAGDYYTAPKALPK